MKKLLSVWLLLAATAAVASVDTPAVVTFRGTGYYTNNWFSCETSPHSDGDGLLFDKVGKFILSPRYEAPVRKVVLRVLVSSEKPTRYLRLSPFVAGREVGTNEVNLVVTNTAAAGTYEFVTFDFPSEDGVDAIRLSLCGAGSTGNWRLAAISVVYGEKSEGEDAYLKQFASELPPPANFRIEDFDEHELRLAADPVEDASGYQFEIARLEGVPRTEDVEHFDAAPEVSAADWEIRSGKVKLGCYTSASQADSKAGEGPVALKIENAGKTNELVWVEVVTDEVAAPITEVSFLAKAGSAEKSDRIVVCGRSATPSDVWTVLGETNFLTTASKTYVTNTVSRDMNIRQVKFRFEAEADRFSVCAMDTLRVVYGGDERRVPIVSAATNAEPHCALTDLSGGRYACKVRALGGSEYRDSSWSELPPVDLAWAGMSVTAPTNVCLNAAGGLLTVSWNRVTDADHYLVTVVSADDPDLAVVRDRKVVATSLTVSVPSVGEYVATVTAVSPGGKSRAVSEAETGEVALDEMGAVTAVAMDKQTIAATWKAVPLAENYQAALVRVGGASETREYGWSADDDGIVLPDGWTCDGEWVHAKWTSGASAYPSLTYTDCWIASGDCGRPVTRLVCRYKCGSSAKATLAATRFEVSVAGATGDWTSVAQRETTTSLSELTLTFPASQDVRRVRFAAQSASKLTMGDVDLGKVSIVYGEETREEVSVASVTKGEVTFGGLDPVGRYRVEVSPQPSVSSLASSATIDLAAERFRETGAVSIGAIRGGLYAEDFSSLSNVTADVEQRKVPLDYWQFFKGSGAAEKLLYTVGTNRTTGGVYAFPDTDREADPYRLGTLATSTMGSSVGIAFRNDGETPVAVSMMSFDMIQRSFRANPQTYVLEWLITDGATSVGTDGKWNSLAIPETAPDTAETQAGRPEVIRSVSLSGADLRVEKVPAGGVLIFRWRHDMVKSGPMMAIDNVKIRFDGVRKGFGVMVR